MSDATSVSNATSINKHFEPNWSLVLTGISAYSVAIGIAYLWGYWAPFGINILDYMGFTDILTATAWPLLGVLSTMLAGMLLSAQNTSNREPSKTNRMGELVFWYWTNFRQLHFLGLFWIWALNTPYKWALLGVLGGLPLAIYVSVQKWMDHIQLSQASKFILVYLVVLAPPMAIHRGQEDSAELMNGVVFKAVYSDLKGVSTSSDLGDAGRLRLIGHRGDTLFLWEPQLKHTVIIKFPSDTPVTVGQVRKVPEAANWRKWFADMKNWISW